MRKILHAADIHLDSPLQKLGTYEQAPVERIRGASRRALENMVDLALQQSVDLVVIAGDLYDGDWNDQNTGLFFVGQARRLVQNDIPLVVIRGNHDAANKMTSTLPLPDNPDGSLIMLDSESVDRRCFESIGVAVHGRSFHKRAETGNMADEYPSPLADMFNLGLLHTSLTGAEGHDSYAPCTPRQLADKGYDYWALGHIHARGEHGLEGAAPINFSGNVQGRHIRECGPKGCLLVEVDARNRCQTTFHELDVVRWQICSLDVSDLQYTDEIIDTFQRWLSDRLDEEGRLLVVRVELVGETPLNHVLRRRRAELRHSLQAVSVTYGHDRVWLEDVKVRTQQPASTSASVDMEGPLASLHAVIEQMRGDEQFGEVMEAELKPLLRKLPADLSGDASPLATYDDQWVSELLESASSEVLARLQSDAGNDRGAGDSSVSVSNT